MTTRNLFGAALLGIALLGAAGAGLIQPAAAQTDTTSAPAAPAQPAAAPPDTANVAVPLTQLISPTPGDYSPAPTLSTGPINTSINYRALTYRNLSEIDLQDAAARHLSDRQIAKILKLAKLTDYSFRSILARINDGQTFPTLCSEYGVSLAALRDVSKETKQVDEYESAVAATGSESVKRPSVLGRGFEAPGSEGTVLAPTPDLDRPLSAAHG